MSDKHLNEREWKNFIKDRDCKGEPLSRALLALDKAVEPAAEVAALDAIDAQLAVLLRQGKGDKALVAYLGEIADAAAKARKRALERAAELEDDGEADDVLLDPKKLLAELNQCRRQPERRAQFGFVDADDDRSPRLALSPRVAGRRLLARLQSATGQKKGAFGTAWIEGTVLMMQLDKPLSGLVRKVRAPVKACGFRITKAVIWNADGSLFEQDEVLDDDAADADADADADAGAAPAAAGTDAGAAFKARLAALLPRVKAARAAGRAGIEELVRMIGEAGALAQRHDFEAAELMLDRVEPRLDGPVPADPAAILRREARDLLDAAADIADHGRFAALIESLRIKADLIADIHGDRAAATALVARAFELVRLRQGREGFDAAAHAELGKLTDRAFKFGVLEGGLKGGGGGRVLLERAAALTESGDADAAAAWQQAFEAANRERDLELIGHCAELLRALALKTGDPRLLTQAAVLIRRLGGADARELGRIAVDAALAARNLGALLGAIGNVQQLGASDEQIAALGQRAAELAIDARDADHLLGAGELLLDLSTPPAGLVAGIGEQALELGASGESSEVCLRAGHLLLDATGGGHAGVPRAAGLAARFASAHSDPQGIVNAAQLLADAGDGEAAARMALVANGLALKLNDAEVALDAVRSAVGSGAPGAELAAAAADAARQTAELAGRLDATGIQVEVAETLLDLETLPAGPTLSVQIAAAAAERAQAKADDHVLHGALLTLLAGTRRLATADGTVGAAVSLADRAGRMAREMAGRAQARGVAGIEQLAMGGALMLEAASIVAAPGGTPPAAVDLATDAAKIALAQSDCDQALKAAALLARAGGGDRAEMIAGGVAAIETKRLQGAAEAGDAEAFVDSAQVLLRAAALRGAAGAPMRGELEAHALRFLADPGTDLDSAQALCEALRKAGADVGDFETGLAHKALKQAEAEGNGGEYGAAVTHLRVALQTSPASGSLVAVAAGQIGERLFADPDAYDEDAALDTAHLLLEAAGMSRSDELLGAAVKAATAVRQRALADGMAEVAAAAQALLDRAAAIVTGAAAQPAVTAPAEADPKFAAVADLSRYNYQDQISKAKTYRDASLVHYTSMAPMSAAEQKTVEEFAETATRRMHAASRELVRGSFDDWDEDGSHLVEMLNLRKDWQAIGKDKALFYDLQKLRAVQSGKQLEAKAYNRAIDAHLAEAGWPDAVDEAKYLALRKAAHGKESAKAYAEGRALHMLHKLAGYLIEERTYQLLPPKDEAGWTDQDTTILGGGTRPDIVLPVAPGKSALLDITASDSQGHIFDKRPAWTKSNKVCDSVEIMYASLDQGTLLGVMLDSQGFSDAEIQRRREANQARLEAAAAEESAVRERVLGALNALGNTAFKRIVGKTATAANHLLKSQGITRRGFNTGMALNPKTAAAALQALDAYLAEQAKGK